MKPLNPTPPTEYHGLMHCGESWVYTQCMERSILAAALKLTNEASEQRCILTAVYEVGE